MIIGAGGAARAAVHGLADYTQDIIILNRSVDKAARLAKEIGCRYGSLNPESAALLDGVEIAIQTTSVGMKPHLDEDPLPWWNPCGTCLVFDMIYEPERTLFLRRAEAASVPVMNGGSMLQAQAALQSALFCDQLSEQYVRNDND